MVHNHLEQIQVYHFCGSPKKNPVKPAHTVLFIHTQCFNHSNAQSFSPMSYVWSSLKSQRFQLGNKNKGNFRDPPTVGPPFSYCWWFRNPAPSTPTPIPLPFPNSLALYGNGSWVPGPIGRLYGWGVSGVPHFRVPGDPDLHPKPIDESPLVLRWSGGNFFFRVRTAGDAPALNGQGFSGVKISPKWGWSAKRVPNGSIRFCGYSTFKLLLNWFKTVQVYVYVYTIIYSSCFLQAIHVIQIVKKLYSCVISFPTWKWTESSQLLGCSLSNLAEASKSCFCHFMTSGFNRP